MEKIYDVTALGELLIDFTENGTSVQGNPLLEANPGGAPCNVLAMLEKLGKKTAFIGKVGKDMFGEQLKTAVEEVGIDTRNLVMDEEVHTTLAFVHTYPDGDRDFSFYRNPGADMMLKKEEVDEDLITLGKDGSRAYYKDLRVEVPGFVQEHTIETTGAGDTFCANSLNYILEHGMEELTEENLKELLTFANAAASLITDPRGKDFPFRNTFLYP